MIAAPPGMPPDFPRHDALVGQEGGEAALEHIRSAADRVARVAVVGALAVEAQVPCRTDEEGLEDVAVRHLVDLRRHVQEATRHRHAPTEAQESEGRKFFSLVVI